MLVVEPRRFHVRERRRKRQLAGLRVRHEIGRHRLIARVVKKIGDAELRELMQARDVGDVRDEDRKSTRLNSSHVSISYAVFCLKKKNKKNSYNMSMNTYIITIILLQPIYILLPYTTLFRSCSRASAQTSACGTSRTPRDRASPADRAGCEENR